ncbi:Translocation protein sec72 [Schizosaccharomyces pombe]|uniref:ER protein translocation subcomplex subunit sec67 n=1 Tax=Schizosaccharomyces pombe (strain 972 / ATCC 24843) TaxID=284812 RepID=SEC67_SCHPO|nr:putative translocation subcomplex subunit Sec72 [Schizosaccharomyces pombe]O14085.1 RecName: Full=Translocation protein sec72 [Schizosaccharomyces pombe 972h-]CAB16260.1 ER protein translocation subcomplex subunit Sec72 (predicted) [Schizosaccharomyces pombe]|eukprot:NP_594381.1 putative translocation subcomplex subunit Sec72 [Schizosaccharomyces pombe]
MVAKQESVVAPQVDVSKWSGKELELGKKVNEYAKSLATFKYPFFIPPPYPPAKPNMALSTQVNKMKQTANEAFKRKKYEEAKKLYGLALQLALNRCTWEPSILTREEASVMLCNRAAAEIALSQFPEALADANAALKIRNNYGKCYYRKAKALEAMHRIEEAKQVVRDGLILAEPVTRNELVALWASYTEKD